MIWVTTSKLKYTYIESSRIQFLSVPSSESIHKRYIKNFFLNAFESASIDTQNLYYFVFYNHKKSLYEISYFYTTKKKFITIFDIIYDQYSMAKTLGHTLFILDELYCVFYNGVLISIHKNNNYTSEDIRIYVSFLYQTYDLNIIDLSLGKQTVFQYDNRKKIKIKIKYENFKTNNVKLFLFSYYVFFFLGLIFIFSYEKKDSISTNTKIVIDEKILKNKKIVSSFVIFLEDIKKYNLKFITLKYKKGYTIIVQGKKKKIHEFLHNTQLNIKILKLFKENKVYKLELLYV